MTFFPSGYGIRKHQAFYKPLPWIHWCKSFLIVECGLLTWQYSGNASLSVDQWFLVVSNLSTGFDVYDVETGRLRRMFHCKIGVKSKQTCLPVIFIQGGEFILGGSSFGESPIFHLGSILPSAVYCLDHQGIFPFTDLSSFWGFVSEKGIVIVTGPRVRSASSPA